MTSLQLERPRRRRGCQVGRPEIPCRRSCLRRVPLQGLLVLPQAKGRAGCVLGWRTAHHLAQQGELAVVCLRWRGWYARQDCLHVSRRFCSMSPLLMLDAQGLEGDL